MNLFLSSLVSFFVLFVFSCPTWAKGGKPPKDANQKIASIEWSSGLKSGGSRKKFFPEMASPALVDNQLFVGTHAGRFYRLDATSGGRLVWEFQAQGPIASGALSDGRLVFFGTNKGMVYALDVATGKPVWELFVGGEVLATPTMAGSTLYVVTTSREVLALNAQTGGLQWKNFFKGFEPRFTMRGNAPVVVSGDRLYVGFADGLVVCLSLSGTTLWSRQLGEGNSAFKDVDAALVVEGSSVYVVGYFGQLIKMARDDGRTLWSYDLKAGANLALNDGLVFVATDDGRVVALGKDSGRRLWEVPLYSGALSSPVLVGRWLLVGTLSGKAYVFESNSGQVMQDVAISSGFINDPMVVGDRVYLLSAQARLYSLLFKP